MRSLYREDGLGQPQIARLLGHDKSWVCRKLSLAEGLSDELTASVRLGLVCARAAVELARLPRGNQDAPAQVVVRRGLTTRQTWGPQSLAPDPCHLGEHSLTGAPMIHRALLGTVVICLGLAGCGSPADPDPGTDASAASGADAGAPSDAGVSRALIGRFQARLVAPTPSSAGYTAVVGKVYDGETPSLLVWEPKLTSGSCTVLTPRVPFCSTPCGSAACVEDDTCQAYPTARSVGTVTVKGVKTSTGATSFSMDPVANNYQPAEELPYPAFAEGDSVTFSAAGSWSPAFSITAIGIAPLELKTTTITLTEGTAVALAWTPPASSGRSTVHVKLDISHHGGTRGKIECEAADTGSLTIDGALITELLHLGVAGFPSIVVTRSASGEAALSAGRVALSLESEIEKEVVIPGVVSCNDDTDCPDGQTCQSDLRCK